MEYSGPEIRILREISSPEPAGNGIAPESRSKSGQINFLMCFFLNLFMGLRKVGALRDSGFFLFLIVFYTISWFLLGFCSKIETLISY